MNDIELKEKMDKLGKLMHELEEKQLDFDMQTRDLNQSIDDLKEELRTVFLERKESAKSDCLEVRYRKGAVKWETKWLEGYAIDHPEIKQYRKEGKPTVAFCLVEEGWKE